jgi:drug/metabolite transporter (DMT)-like permease
VVTYVNPAVAVAAGVGLGGERFTRGTALAFVLILAGSIVATRRTAPASEAGPDR